MPHPRSRIAAAGAAIDYLEQTLGDTEWRIGIGTGSTVNAFIELLGDFHAQHRQRLKTVVASSNTSKEMLVSKGIQVTEANQVIDLDAYIDGADRITGNGAMIKGGGGAMFGEKLIAQLARTFICIAETSKLVDMLGGFPVAVEVPDRARSQVARKLVTLGGQPELRENFITDQGNVILDVHNLSLIDPAAMEDSINAITGVLENGLFGHNRSQVILLGDGDRVTRLQAK